MDHPKMCVCPYHRSNCNFWYQQQIFNDYSHIHVLCMRFLYRWQLLREGHLTHEIQQELQLYRWRNHSVVNTWHCEQVPIPENLPLSFRKDEGNILLCGRQSPRQIRFFVNNVRLLMDDIPLVEYIYRYNRYNLNIPTTDRSGIGGMSAIWVILLHVAVVTCQSFAGCDSIAYMLHYADNK